MVFVQWFYTTRVQQVALPKPESSVLRAGVSVLGQFHGTVERWENARWFSPGYFRRVNRSTLLLMALGVSLGAILAFVSFRHRGLARRDRYSRSLDRQELPANEDTKNGKRPRVSWKSSLVADIRVVSFVTALAFHWIADRTLKKVAVDSPSMNSGEGGIDDFFRHLDDVSLPYVIAAAT
ncbi:hypothetical protein X777_01645 [Ooceraea biroi]|uniref:Uncharacterized protein n=1 Tax=Ooceraea biroi TaxID=2015173 RepID=A0A026WPM2_OOCBI|nr:hypothetical protein X777_01645 [Ooceraea biroi]